MNQENQPHSPNKRVEEVEKDNANQEPCVTAVSEEDDEPSSTFLDKAIAFLVLIYPFSKLIELLQDLLHDRLPQSIANISVLIGIIGFLVAIGWLAKIVYTYRIKLFSK
ncbi:MAG: hypothetical protein WCP72_05100 [Desulfomonile sp.]